MNSFALHAQRSIWNDQFHDHIYLKQECVMELEQGGTDEHLSLHLTKEKLKHAKLIFVPVFYCGHCFLVVANFPKHTFDYLDSLVTNSGYELACYVTANLKKY